MPRKKKNAPYKNKKEVPETQKKNENVPDQTPEKLLSEQKFTCSQCGSNDGIETQMTEQTYNGQRIVRHWIQCEKCLQINVTRDVWKA
jgi:DNA-directed RNA polymerase subunit M/transcription elongation factor TFIIS